MNRLLELLTFLFATFFLNPFFTFVNTTTTTSAGPAANPATAIPNKPGLIMLSTASPKLMSLKIRNHGKDSFYV